MLKNYYEENFPPELYSNLLELHNAIDMHDDVFYPYNLNFNQLRELISILTAVYPLDYNFRQNNSKINSFGELRISYHNYDTRLFNEELRKIKDELNNRIPLSASNYEIVKYIYDYIIDNIEYDMKAYDEVAANATSDKDKTIEIMDKYGSIFDMYGAVVDKKAVCSGLSMLFQELLKSFGIDSIVVVGYVVNKGELTNIGHSVLLVELNNRLAYCDVTAGMRCTNDLRIRLYDYFMVGSSKMYEIFKPLDMYRNLDFENNLSYHEHYELAFDNAEAIRSFLSRQILKRRVMVIYFKYVGKALSEERLNKLIGDIVGSKLTYQCKHGIINQDGNVSIKIYKQGGEGYDR